MDSFEKCHLKDISPSFYCTTIILSVIGNYFYCERHVVHPQARHKFHVPPKSTLEALAAASSGDIRGAINALQFACLKGRVVW